MVITLKRRSTDQSNANTKNSGGADNKTLDTSADNQH